MDEKLTLDPDDHMRWIYNPYHPDYHSDRAKDLRMRRWASLNSAPSWFFQLEDRYHKDGERRDG